MMSRRGDGLLVSYVLKAAENGKRVIFVLSDDTDVFVLGVSGRSRAAVQCFQPSLSLCLDQTRKRLFFGVKKPCLV